jgi:hypothetical protein
MRIYSHPCFRLVHNDHAHNFVNSNHFLFSLPLASSRIATRLMNTARNDEVPKFFKRPAGPTEEDLASLSIDELFKPFLDCPLQLSASSEQSCRQLERQLASPYLDNASYYTSHPKRPKKPLPLREPAAFFVKFSLLGAIDCIYSIRPNSCSCESLRMQCEFTRHGYVPTDYDLQLRQQAWKSHMAFSDATCTRGISGRMCQFARFRLSDWLEVMQKGQYLHVCDERFAWLLYEINHHQGLEAHSQHGLCIPISST